MEINTATSVPDLIKWHGNMAKASRESGLSEMTIKKYRYDTECEFHIIINGRLFTHHKNSRIIK